MLLSASPLGLPPGLCPGPSGELIAFCRPPADFFMSSAWEKTGTQKWWYDKVLGKTPGCDNFNKEILLIIFQIVMNLNSKSFNWSIYLILVQDILCSSKGCLEYILCTIQACTKCFEPYKQRWQAYNCSWEETFN